MASSSNAFFSGLEIEKVEVKKRFTTNEIHAVFSIGEKIFIHHTLEVDSYC